MTVGEGFDVAHARRHEGLGLISMEERARLINGRLTIPFRAEPWDDGRGLCATQRRGLGREPDTAASCQRPTRLSQTSVAMSAIGNRLTPIRGERVLTTGGALPIEDRTFSPRSP
jgi:hypothetical protein